MPPRQRDRERQQRQAERQRQGTERVVRREAVLGQRDGMQRAVDGDREAEHERERRPQAGPESGQGHADNGAARRRA